MQLFTINSPCLGFILIVGCPLAFRSSRDRPGLVMLGVHGLGSANDASRMQRIRVQSGAHQRLLVDGWGSAARPAARNNFCHS